MSGSSFDGIRLCATCVATFPEGNSSCPTCGNSSSEPAATPNVETDVKKPSPIDPNPYAAPHVDLHSAGPTFRLSTLMLTITLISVCLGVATWFPGVGLGLALLATPAYVRTALAGFRLRREGKPPTIEEKVFIFFASLAIVTSIVVAAGAAFYGTCWVGLYGGVVVSEAVGVKGLDTIMPGLIAGVVVGGAGGLAALFFAIRWLWPYRKF